MGPEGLVLGDGLLKHCNSFSKGIFHFVFCYTVGEQLVSSGYKLKFGCSGLFIEFLPIPVQ